MEENPQPISTSETPVQPSQPQSISVQKSSDKSPIFWVGLAILVTLLASSGYYLFAKKNTAQPVPSPVPLVSTSPVADPTANWKTYRNEKYQYQFQYPKEWLYLESTNSAYMVLDNKPNITLSKAEAPAGPITVVVNICIYSKTNQPYPCERSSAEKLVKVKDTLKPESVKETSITVADQTQVQQISGILGGSPLTEGLYIKYTIIPLGEYLLLIMLNEQKYDNVYDQILSTFKFIKSSNDTNLQTLELPNGDIKITNLLGKFEVIVPVTYNLVGEANKFSVSFSGIDSGKPGPHDFASILFTLKKLEGKSLFDTVQDEYVSIKQNNRESVNSSDIKSITLNGAKGYFFECPFLVIQTCTYLSLQGDDYLVIVSNYSDENNRGYAIEIDQILSTLKLLN